MLRRIIGHSITRRRRRKLLSFVAISLGIAAVTTVATIAVDVGDRINHELQSVGANIVVTPAADSFPISIGNVDFRPAGSGAYLPESALPRIKSIFWRNSIIAFAPFVYAPARSGGTRFVLIGTWFSKTLPVSGGGSFTTGIEALHPAWKLTGRWPQSGDAFAAVAGSQLAQELDLKAGQTLSIGAAGAFAQFHISGILETGGIEDQEMLAPLVTVQKLAGLEGKVRRVEVSAITKPVDALDRTPVARMSPQQFERWSCSNYPSTVAYQIAQAIPGSSAKPVYRIAETEGKILNRAGLLMAILAAVALITAALAVSSTMLASMLERRHEIGLFKALGATDARIASILLAETCLIGLAGGAAGYGLGSLLAERLARAVLGAPLNIHWVVFPCVLALALVVTVAGSALPLRRGLNMTAALALRHE
jgi:putative ABC transport system permease protein